MNQALSTSALTSLKSYVEQLKEPSFSKSEKRRLPEDTLTSNYVETARKLLEYYSSDWGTDIGGVSPGGLAGQLSQGNLHDRLTALSMSGSVIGHFVDKYLAEREELFDKQLDSMTGHDVQKLAFQILAELR